MILEWVFVFSLMIYCGMFLLINIPRFRRKSETDNRPRVSVVVAARDEEVNIGGCLESLLHQDYPDYDIIVVNDRSMDHTSDEINKMRGGSNRIMEIQLQDNPSGLTGKQNALHHGIEHAGGEVILMTDADCIADRKWIQHMVTSLGEGDLVFGISEIAPVRGLFQILQAMELRFLFGIARGLIRLGIPGSCMGNNIGFKKDAYMQTGGYPAMGYQPTEDYALMHQFKQKGFRICMDETAGLIRTRPLDSLSRWFHQHTRWLYGHFRSKSRLQLGLLPVAVVHCLWPVLFFSAGLTNQVLCLLLLKILLDILTAAPGLSMKRLTLTPVFLLYYILSTPFFLVLPLFIRKTTWKNDTITLNGKSQNPNNKFQTS